MKYIKKFDTHAEYEAAESGLILPNVSFCVDTPNEVHYNPYVEPVETRVVLKVNVIDTTHPTYFIRPGGESKFVSVEIDGVEQPSVVSNYTFDTTGEHVVKCSLTDPTSIGSASFLNISSIISVTIPDTVTNIEGEAFEGCRGLTSAAIGNGVTSIGDFAFSGCSSLTSIDIPDSVTSIDSQAFYSCSGMTTCTIGSGVTSIGESAFNSCTRLLNVTIFASTPPTAIYSRNWNAFSYGTDCPIYVPNGSVDAYKAARGWNNYSSRIQAIP